jgi:TonB-dependent SusC/RagA subfamily outer membrane receptor
MQGLSPVFRIACGMFDPKGFNLKFVQKKPTTMGKFVVVCFTLLISVLQINAQRKNVYGNVYAFKNLALNNIKVSSAKSKTTTQTDSLGNFRIVCEMEDKLEFTGFGFQKKVIKLEKQQNNTNVKLIFKGGNKNIDLAVENGHVSKENLESSIELYPDQNFEYYNYADIFTAISRIYAGNDNIKVTGKDVYVRKEKSTFSAVPALFMVNGKLALEISDILTSEIESIEIIPDGSSKYGTRAANGVVLVTTIQNK